MSCLYCSL